MPMSVAYVIGSVVGLGLAIVACIFLMKEEKAKKYNNFWYTIHKIINFKALIIDKILKFLYVLSTCVVMCTGFFMLFSFDSYWGMTSWNGFAGLGLLILGPIVIRIVYELLMMFVLLVENTIAIRNKLTGKEEATVANNTVQVDATPAEYVFCTKCGERYDKNKGECPKCSGEKKENKILDSIIN